MDFPYKQYGKLFFRPVIPVFLTADGNSFGYEALLDSGADYSIFPAEIARELGINFEAGTKTEFGGIGKDGKKPVGYFHKITLQLESDSFETLVAFSDDIADYGYGVLGQIGFFDHFTVKFMYQDRKVRVSKTI